MLNKRDLICSLLTSTRQEFGLGVITVLEILGSSLPLPLLCDLGQILFPSHKA